MVEKFNLKEMLKEIELERQHGTKESGRVTQEEIAKRIEQREKMQIMEKDQDFDSQ